MFTILLRQFLLACSLSFWMASTQAELSANTTSISNGAKALVSVNFPKPVTGDLYLAVSINNGLYFFGEQGAKFSPAIIPYQRNSLFNSKFDVLEVASIGVPAGIYTLYQVVTFPDKDPRDFNNWVGGLGGLSSLNFSINQVQTFTTPTLVPPNSSSSNCAGSKVKSAYFVERKADDDDDCPNTYVQAPTLLPSATNSGKDLYAAKCFNGCHGNPRANKDNVQKGKDFNNIRSAINKNKGSMGVALKGISDSELKTIAEYLKTF